MDYIWNNSLNYTEMNFIKKKTKQMTNSFSSEYNNIVTNLTKLNLYGIVV